MRTVRDRLLPKIASLLRDRGNPFSTGRWSFATPRATGRVGQGVNVVRTFAVIALIPILLLAACDGGDADDDREAQAAAPRATRTAAPATDGEWWRPAPNSTWQWQLQGELNVGYNVDIYDIDLFDSDPALIETLHAAGRRVICYFSAGSAENWRPDFDEFSEDDVGKPLDGWEGERWVDIRSPRVRTIMLARLDLARERGCDGVEPDNVASYDDDTGYDLSFEDQLAFNRLIADEAHARGLAVGLKNGGEQVPELVEWYDFALNEECHEYEECADFAPFVAAGKLVLNVEYISSRGAALDLAQSVCPQAAMAGLRTLILPLDLDDTFRVACDP